MKPTSDQRQANRAWEERTDNGRDTASSATDRLPSADYLRALAIALLIFSVSFISYSRTLPPNADEMMNYALAESIAKLGQVDVDSVSTVGANPEEYGLFGRRYSKYGPVQAVLALPLLLLARLLPIGMVDAALLQNHILTAITAGIVYLFVRRLGYRPLIGLILAFAFFFATPAWVHAKRFFGEPTTTLWLLLVFYWGYQAQRSGSRRAHLLTGLAIGLAVASKYVNVIFLAPVVLWLLSPSFRGAAGFWEKARAATSRVLIPVGLGGLPIALALGAYNSARFGSPIESGYARWEQFDTPLLEGVTGFLFSPGKSLFVYAPVLLLLLFWGWAFYRREQWLATLILVVSILHICVYGTWWVWWGAWTWGPRFLVPLMPLLVIPLAEGLSRACLGRYAFGALFAIGVVIQALGVSVDHIVYMAYLLPLNPEPDTLTLYDINRQPILAQIQFLNRQWLDFAWVNRAGPDLVRLSTLLPSLLAALLSALLLVFVWRRPGIRLSAGAVALSTVAVALATLFTLNRYYTADDPYWRALGERIGESSANSAIVFTAPDRVVPYLNVQKAPISTVGWAEHPQPLQPRFERLLLPAISDRETVWLVSQYGRGAPPNGIERTLGERLVKLEERSYGPLRLARYRQPDSVSPTPLDTKLAEGVSLIGYRVAQTEPLAPGGRIDLTFFWSAEAPLAGDRSVFVHLVQNGPNGDRLVAQGDGPPGDGYRPTSTWQAKNRIADYHQIALPDDFLPQPGSTYSIRVGLYDLASGKRLPVAEPGRATVGEDFVVILVR